MLNYYLKHVDLQNRLFKLHVIYYTWDLSFCCKKIIRNKKKTNWSV